MVAKDWSKLKSSSLQQVGSRPMLRQKQFYESFCEHWPSFADVAEPFFSRIR